MSWREPWWDSWQRAWSSPAIRTGTKIRTKLLALAGLGLLVWLWSHYSGRVVGQALAQVGWKLLPLSLLALLWAPWDALSMAFLLGRPLQRRLLLLEWSSDGLARLIPSAGLGGEPFRYRHLARLHPQPGRLVLVYRLLHAITGLAASAILATLCLQQGWSPHYPWKSVAGGSAALGILLMVGLLARAPWPRSVVLRSLAAKSISRILQVAEMAAILGCLGVALDWQTVLRFQAYLAACATLFTLVPGGLGIQEWALIQAAQDAGLSAELGFQVGLIRRCRQLLWAGWGLGAATWLEAEGSAKDQRPR